MIWLPFALCCWGLLCELPWKHPDGLFEGTVVGLHVELVSSTRHPVGTRP